MKLEEEINLVIPFKDERDKVIVNLVHTYNVFLNRTLEALKPFDINDQHYNILKTLQDQFPKPISVGQLKSLLFNKRGDLTRLLDKLSDMGFIVRENNAENRRVVQATISKLGKERLRQIDSKLAEQRDPRDNISEKEAMTLNTLLDQLRG
jgi:MarR family transcriptional regulator, 2-MHQ and catechol-resistance regulon repressor